MWQETLQGREQAGISSTENGIVREVEAVFEVEDNLFSGAVGSGALSGERLKRIRHYVTTTPSITARASL